MQTRKTFMTILPLFVLTVHILYAFLDISAIGFSSFYVMMIVENKHK